MNFEVVLTCAVTGAGDTVGKSDKVPVSAKDIADDAIESAKAGATSVHIHVRDPMSGKGSRDGPCRTRSPSAGRTSVPRPPGRGRLGLSRWDRDLRRLRRYSGR